MMLVPTELKSSPIHGLGVYAAAPVKAGAKIWELREGFDVFMDIAFISGLPPLVQGFVDKYGYPHHSRKNTIILEIDSGRFMNHSDTPNTDFKTPEVGFALVDIAVGEELLCNYSEFCFDGFTLLP